MPNNSLNSKRIAKNTIMLYARMVVVIIVGLYTSRVVLDALGVEDFGLYNVVGGVVSLFAFLRTSMEKCTQRFLNVEMVKENGNVADTFSVAVVIHVCIAIIALILLETVGLWFLNNYIQIPDGREYAANVVFQSVVVGLLCTIMTIPFSAGIIAHERMGIFAIISIIDCIFKLVIALCVLKASYDHLIFYSVLMLAVSLFNFSCYFIYCRKFLITSKFRFVKEFEPYREMLRYTSWALFGHAMIMGCNQGNSILINMFYGVTANAAMAVANQVNNHVLQLTGNFQTAFNPQITKAYSSGDNEYLKKLIYSTSKISFFLLTIVSLPIFFNIDDLLGLWLKEVPQYSNEFCILMITSGILQATSAPLNFCVMASGKIKWFQIVTGSVFISDVVILYLLFSMGLPPVTAMWVKVSIMFGVYGVRLFFTNKVFPFVRISEYLKKVALPLIVSVMLNVGFAFLIMRTSSPLVYKLGSTAILIVFSCLISYFIGFNQQEKRMIKNLVASKIKRK